MFVCFSDITGTAIYEDNGCLAMLTMIQLSGGNVTKQLWYGLLHLS